ncbi:hypothetical protein CERZMDRAFT_102599 [Cercospora zeae-maydis SCOH1-5]|uniref:F-box domain-containing protein n=1 Tax=Cercospora zeae-maydis SCOH1-5 TaxID=717836 RepID=A0A6A6F0N9_9PEZI|nr:hypothetical protein CERZMDRAFT_102599 [Cercospora zeae-maydis SCOH1-5]
MTAPDATNQCHFWRLPAELRLNIYELVYEDCLKPHPIRLADAFPPTQSKSLPLTCREFYHDVRKLHNRAHPATMPPSQNTRSGQNKKNLYLWITSHGGIITLKMFVTDGDWELVNLRTVHGDDVTANANKWGAKWSHSSQRLGADLSTEIIMHMFSDRACEIQEDWYFRFPPSHWIELLTTYGPTATQCLMTVD